MYFVRDNVKIALFFVVISIIGLYYLLEALFVFIAIMLGYNYVHIKLVSGG